MYTDPENVFFFHIKGHAVCTLCPHRQQQCLLLLYVRHKRHHSLNIQLSGMDQANGQIFYIPIQPDLISVPHTVQPHGFLNGQLTLQTADSPIFIICHV